MDTNPKGGCEKCWNPNPGQHNPGCPILMGTPESEEKWEKGFTFGFADNHIPHWLWKNYPQSFILGWRAGRAEIDRLVDNVAQARIWGPEY